MSTIKKWKLLSEEDISPSQWFPLYKHVVELPDGKIIDDFIVSKLGDVAMVVPVTAKREIYFVRQHKHGVDDITLELPAGRTDGRSPEQAAKDELREELGIVAGSIESLGHWYITPTKDSAICYGFIVEDSEITIAQDLDETEAIEAILVPISQLEAKIVSGEIQGADTLTTLFKAKILHPEIFNV